SGPIGHVTKAYERYQEDLHDQASFVFSTYGAGKWEGRQEGLQEGRQEGLQEGERIGEQKGELKGKTEMLTRLLQRRFGNVPDWAGEKMANAELSELEAWSLRIFDARSLDDVFSDKT
ncbi:MAG: DUF4351 domain-containing protein, partial [Magnetococcales bacterium]|nr:DUF4351 domain-containing protein [Magnetococcales bacterium]